MRLFTNIVLFFTATLTTQLMAEEKLVNAYLYAADYAKGHKTVYLADPQKGYHEVGLSTANIYGPFKTKVAKDGTLLLCQKQVAPPEVKSISGYIYPPIAEVKIPSNIKEPLLVLIPAKGEMLYRALVIDRSVSNFSKGSYKLINFSPRNIRGMIGKTLVKASAREITTFNPSKNNTEARLKVQFQYMEGNRWSTFGTSYWANKADKRTLLCAYITPATGRMKIRGIPVKEPIKIPVREPVTTH